MLDKLFKHEWKRVWKLPTGMLVLINIMAVIVGLSFASPVWDGDSSVLGLLAGMMMFFYAASFIGIAFAGSIYLAVNFYKGTYSDEGYLLHTLPVTADQILLSKISIICIWQLIIGAGLVLAAGISILLAALSLGADFTLFFGDIRLILDDIFMVIEEYEDWWAMLVFSVILNGIVQFVFNGVYVAASITIGQLERKHKILGAIVSAIVISIIISIVSGIITIPTQMAVTGVFDAWEGASHWMVLLTQWLNLILNIAATAALYLISRYIMTRKLNLD